MNQPIPPHIVCLVEFFPEKANGILCITGTERDMVAKCHSKETFGGHANDISHDSRHVLPPRYSAHQDIPVFLRIESVQLVVNMGAVFQHIMFQVLKVTFEPDTDSMLAECSGIIDTRCLLDITVIRSFLSDKNSPWFF